MKRHSLFYIVVILSFYLLSSSYVYFNYSKLRFSFFYKHNENSTRNRFDVFEKESVAYLYEKIPEINTFEETFEEFEDSLCHVCVVIPSINRRKRFLSILVSSLLQNFPLNEYFRNVTFKIINFEQSGFHKEFYFLKSLLWNSSFFDFIEPSREEMDKKIRNYIFSSLKDDDSNFDFIESAKPINRPEDVNYQRYDDLEWHRKETVDFMFSLEQCRGFEYILMIEDDSYSSTNAFRKISTKIIPRLNEIRAKTEISSSSSTKSVLYNVMRFFNFQDRIDENKKYELDWLLVKLYVTDYWDGFSFVSFIVTLVIIFVIIIYHLLIILYLWKLHVWKSKNPGLSRSLSEERNDGLPFHFDEEEVEVEELENDNPHNLSGIEFGGYYGVNLLKNNVERYFALFVIIIIVFLLILFLCQIYMILSLGKQNILPRVPGFHVMGEDSKLGSFSATVSQIYNGNILFPKVFNFLGGSLLNSESIGIDDLLNYANEHFKISSYIYIPSLFQHVGWSSSNWKKNQGFLHMKQSNSFRNGPFGYNFW